MCKTYTHLPYLDIGDKLVSIEGEDATGMTLDEIKQIRMVFNHRHGSRPVEISVAFFFDPTCIKFEKDATGSNSNTVVVSAFELWAPEHSKQMLIK